MFFSVSCVSSGQRHNECPKHGVGKAERDHKEQLTHHVSAIRPGKRPRIPATAVNEVHVKCQPQQQESCSSSEVPEMHPSETMIKPVETSEDKVKL